MSRSTGLIVTMALASLIWASVLTVWTVNLSRKGACDYREFEYAWSQGEKPEKPLTFSECMVSAERDRVMREYGRPVRL